MTAVALLFCTEFMIHRPCLLEASLSPELVSCSNKLTNHYKEISKVSQTPEQRENKLTRACLYEYAHCSVYVAAQIRSNF